MFFHNNEAIRSLVDWQHAWLQDILLLIKVGLIAYVMLDDSRSSVSLILLTFQLSTWKYFSSPLSPSSLHWTPPVPTWYLKERVSHTILSPEFFLSFFILNLFNAINYFQSRQKIKVSPCAVTKKFVVLTDIFIIVIKKCAHSAFARQE